MATAYMPMRLKRKDLEQVNEDFSDFSLSSPARKIRRLDADLPPIMEEEEAVPQLPQAPIVDHVFEDELPFTNQNEERALVLFKPVNSHLLTHPSSLAPNFSVDSDIISGLKNQFPWFRNHGSHLKIAEVEEDNEDNVNAKECMAVVPWVPSQCLRTVDLNIPSAEAPLELMEDEEMGEAAMEIEDSNASAELGYMNDSFGGVRGRDGLHQWQEQHCMTPQLPKNISTPITWFR
ncbi:hypothetical protein HS088_TW23G00694 [Tripterygium wilfordii]|uniref:Uncharacterized protein n=1 Tax=Tripterygium wilfordii TaxID=458696 RepID=A0A7J7BVR4_TRIWF|nr:uncharacterized protein LOC119992538 [Tripterygium wilfordii]KAF5725961.1 hypothetical protein HS088_TW23G00694 [Tripterygium wilfordii]